MTDEQKETPQKAADPKDDPDVVWMSCRASEKCPGNYAKISRKWKGDSGGAAVRYTCTTCKRPFHVNF